MLNFSFYLTMAIFCVVCTFMILLVLIQKGRGGGLTGAFGGAGANTAFGSKTGDVLTWATSIVFGVFLILAVALNLMADRMTATPLPGTAVSTPAAPAEGTPSPAAAPTPGAESPANPATMPSTTQP